MGLRPAFAHTGHPFLSEPLPYLEPRLREIFGIALTQSLALTDETARGDHPSKSICIDSLRGGNRVSLRAPKDTAASLRIMVQRLEQTVDPEQDPEARAELKRILMVRIANLEALEALKVEALICAPKDPAKPSPHSTDPIRPPLLPQPASPSASDAKNSVPTLEPDRA